MQPRLASNTTLRREFLKFRDYKRTPPWPVCALFKYCPTVHFQTKGSLCLQLTLLADVIDGPLAAVPFCFLPAPCGYNERRLLAVRSLSSAVFPSWTQQHLFLFLSSVLSLCLHFLFSDSFLITACPLLSYTPSPSVRSRNAHMYGEIQSVLRRKTPFPLYL